MKAKQNKPSPPTLDQLGLAEIQRSRLLLAASADLIAACNHARKPPRVIMGDGFEFSDDALLAWHVRFLEETARELEEEAEENEREASRMRDEAIAVRRRRRAA